MTDRDVDHFRPSRHLADVHYEIRGPLARRAYEIECEGYHVIKLNIGNPAAYGFQMPERMRLAVTEHLAESEGYCHQKGIASAREAVVADARSRGVRGVTVDDVFMGNGVSELIVMTLEALLEPGDEVLLPAPDYPLWTAAVVLTGARPVYYDCPPAQIFVPDPAAIEALVTPRTRAIVMINPNNPTGAVYPREVVEGIAAIAARHRLLLCSDEIYDRILYDGAKHVLAASVCEGTLCATFGGLSKVFRACGLRTGWVYFTGTTDAAGEYLRAIELLASLRLCSNVPGQWAVRAALRGPKCIVDLTAPKGRLGRQRRAVIDCVARSKYLALVPPRGALYAFVGVRTEALPDFDDARFAMNLLEAKHVLVVPGSSFNVGYRDHFRVTLLPDEHTLTEVFTRVESLLDDQALRGRARVTPPRGE